MSSSDDIFHPPPNQPQGNLPSRLDKHESDLEENARKGFGRSNDKSLPDFLNVKKQLVFYASYHSNPINIAIHVVCIPMILWSWLLILAHIPIPSSLSTTIQTLLSLPISSYLNPFSYLPSFSTTPLPKDASTIWGALAAAAPRVKQLGPYLAWQPNLALLWNVAYVAYYIALEPFAGATYIPQALLSQLTVTYLATSPSTSSLKIALYIQLGSWIAQFLAHGVAEGRAPALLDNLLQAVVLAPFFSHLEVLFHLFNYNPSLQKEIQEGAREKRAAFAASRSQNKSMKRGKKVQ